MGVVRVRQASGIGLPGCVVLLAGCCLLEAGCSKQAARPANKANTLSSYKLQWTYDAHLFWGYWGKSEDHLCFANSEANTLDILDRRTGVLLRSVQVPFTEVHCDRNLPILVLNSTAHLFSSAYSDDCRTIDLPTGNTASVKSSLGTLDKSAAESVTVSGTTLFYKDTATMAAWNVPFQKEGFSVLSHCRHFIASRNVYVLTDVYKGKIRPTDLLPGGGVTGKPVGCSLKVYSKGTGKSLWHLPVEPRLVFCAESDSAVLVNCGDLNTFRAHTVNTGRQLWQRQLPGASFSARNGDVAMFLEQGGIRAVDANTGSDLGQLTFQHEVCALPFDMSKGLATTPGLYWSDAFVVCEEGKSLNGKPILRLRCYGKDASDPNAAQRR